jgi:YbbR domain-containing protein
LRREENKIFAMTKDSRLSILSHRNLKWLVLCFLLGVCIFVLYPSLPFHETDIFVPVDPGKIPAGLTLSGQPLKGLEVRVRAPKSTIGTLAEVKIRYELDLSGVAVGVTSIPINRNHIPLPKGVSIDRITPAFLTVKVEKEVVKELPVKIAFTGKPATGFSAAGAVAKPLSVTLKGPENILVPMTEILTKPIDIRGLSEPFKKEIALNLPENIGVVSPSGIVLAEIFIEETIVTRTFNDIVVEGKDTPYSFSITPAAIQMEVKGPVNILETLQAKNGIKVYVDLKGLKPGVYVRRAVITLPVKTTLVGVKPEIFTVKIKSKTS